MSDGVPGEVSAARLVASKHGPATAGVESQVPTARRAPPLVLLATRPRKGSTIPLIAWDCRLGDAQPLARKSKELARIGIAAEGCGW